MDKLQSLKYVLLFCLIVPIISLNVTVGCARKNEEVEKKIVEALKLFSADSYYDIDLSGIQRGKGSLGASINALALAEDILYKKEGEKNLAKRFPLAAQKVAAKYKDSFKSFSLLILIKDPNQLPLAHIQAILGKENSVESGVASRSSRYGGGSIKVKWYKYGWCWFGVDEAGKVVALVADCGAIKIPTEKQD